MEWEPAPRGEWELLAELSKSGRLEFAGANELLTLQKLSHQGYVTTEDDGDWKLTQEGREYFEQLPVPAFEKLTGRDQG